MNKFKLWNLILGVFLADIQNLLLSGKTFASNKYLASAWLYPSIVQSWKITTKGFLRIDCFQTTNLFPANKRIAKLFPIPLITKALLQRHIFETWNRAIPRRLSTDIALALQCYRVAFPLICHCLCTAIMLTLHLKGSALLLLYAWIMVENRRESRNEPVKSTPKHQQESIIEDSALQIAGCPRRVFWPKIFTDKAFGNHPALVEHLCKPNGTMPRFMHNTHL